MAHATTDKIPVIPRVPERVSAHSSITAEQVSQLVDQFYERVRADSRLAPIFDVVSTVPYLPNDTMALSLTGTKRWPKAKVLHRFGLNHCQLSKQLLEQAAEEVDLAINQNLPLLESLSQQHADFAAIAERMHALFIQKPA
mgnify:CR=1 FL=1